MFYKLRDAKTGRYLSESTTSLIYRGNKRSSGRTWKNSSSPITTLNYIWYRAARECVYLYGVKQRNTYNTKICFDSMLQSLGYRGPIQLVTFDKDMKELSSEVVDETESRRKAFLKAIINETGLNQLAVCDSFDDPSKLNTWKYIDVEWTSDSSPSKELDLVIRNDIKAMGLSRTVKFLSNTRHHCWCNITSFRFKNPDDILMWRLGLSVPIGKIIECNVSNIADDIEKIRSTVNISL